MKQSFGMAGKLKLAKKTIIRLRRDLAEERLKLAEEQLRSSDCCIETKRKVLQEGFAMGKEQRLHEAALDLIDMVKLRVLNDKAIRTWPKQK